MCYHYVIRIAWILSIQFTAISPTNSTTSTTSTASTSSLPEALPIVWRTSTTTQLPALPTYLIPPPITPQNDNIAPKQQQTTQTSSTHNHPNHNYDMQHSSQNSDKNRTLKQLLEDINNLDLNRNKQQSSDYNNYHHLQNMSEQNESGDRAERDRSRLQAYGASFPVLGQGSSNVSLGSHFVNAGNDSMDRFRYEGTLMAFANNPFSNGKGVGKAKKCYNSKKCNSTSSNSPHSSNFLLDNSVPSSKPGDANDNFDPLNQPPADNDSSTEPRYKRGVIHLYNMVSCATGCNPLIYKGYGCYCGFLGSGYAVDGIDRCCKFHDWCYDTAKCPMYLEYFIPYYWKCYHRRPICAIEHGEWGGAGSCAQRLCECDRVLSECLSRYPCPSTRAICTSSPWRLLQNAFMIL